MRQRLARFGGVGVFLLGLGVQVAGWTNGAVGIALMALGGLWTLGVLAGPPTAVRAKNAIVSSVLEELQTSKTVADVDRRRWIRGVAQRMLGELAVARERLEEARRQGAYWNAEVSSLTADEWAASHTAVSDEPELAQHYMTVRLAYEELNRINAIVIERSRHPVVPSSLIDGTDRLNDAITRIADGERCLKQVVDSL
jgi:hypothetical protein